MAHFMVEGMVIRNGFLWLGCPDAIRQALEGLGGITRVGFDVGTRTFHLEGPTADDRAAVEAAVASAGNFAILDWQSE